MHSETPKRLHLQASRARRVVTAGMIEARHDIEIMDPDHVICHVDKGGKLAMEMTVQAGKGYVPASLNKAEDAPIGLIAVDAIYSPVRKVAYKVDNARVGQQTDYDRLTMQLETDGSVTPEDAVGLAARILQDQLAALRQLRGAAPRASRASAGPSCRSTRTCCARSTSSSCRCARPTA